MRKLGKGRYCENLATKYKSIEPASHDALFLFNLFKSQYKHGGVRVGGKSYRECVFVDEGHPDLYGAYELFEARDGRRVGFK
jgi:hypothetical protein